MIMWKQIPGWEHRYEVSDAGAVRSKDMQVKAGRGEGGCAIRKGRVLKPVVKGGRYLCVTLAHGVVRQQFLIHDLVALAYIGAKPNGLEVRHLNDNKYDNTVPNLAYGTRSDNEQDRQRNNRVPKGVKHGCAKLTEAQVRDIRSTRGGVKHLAAALGVTPATVFAIRARRTWKHLPC